jgi:hypothetical protein
VPIPAVVPARCDLHDLARITHLITAQHLACFLFVSCFSLSLMCMCSCAHPPRCRAREWVLGCAFQITALPLCSFSLTRCHPSLLILTSLTRCHPSLLILTHSLPSVSARFHSLAHCPQYPPHLSRLRTYSRSLLHALNLALSPTYTKVRYCAPTP